MHSHFVDSGMYKNTKYPVFKFTADSLHVIDIFVAGTYVISVKTRPYPHAGTDSPVYLTMKDAESNACATVRLHNGQEIFQTGS